MAHPPQRSYGPGSSERKELEEALTQMEKDSPFEVPCIVNGKPVGGSFQLALSLLLTTDLRPVFPP